MKTIWFKTIRFFVARQYGESIDTVLHWGAAKFRMAEQSIMLSPDPIVQGSANGFAMMGAANQDRASREKDGLIQDYHILPDLLTLARRKGILEARKEDKKVLTKQNSNVINMILEA